jgi:hypothetical protein
MDPFVIILTAVVFIAIFNNSRQKIDKDNNEPAKMVEKRCPPHKWQHIEIKDHEGVTHGWKLVCDHCGPFKTQEQPPKMDY